MYIPQTGIFSFLKFIFGTKVNRSDNHISSKCPDKKDRTKHKCANCNSSRVESIKAKALGHTTSSQECPLFKTELNNVMEKTMGMSKSMTISKNWIVT